jgi:hypothetical protein
MLDELHVQVYVPEDLPDRQANAIIRTLKSPTFQKALRRSLKTVVSTFPALAVVSFRLSR